MDDPSYRLPFVNGVQMFRGSCLDHLALGVPREVEKMIFQSLGAQLPQRPTLRAVRTDSSGGKVLEVERHRLALSFALGRTTPPSAVPHARRGRPHQNTEIGVSAGAAHWRASIAAVSAPRTIAVVIRAIRLSGA